MEWQGKINDRKLCHLISFIDQNILTGVVGSQETLQAFIKDTLMASVPEKSQI